MNHCLTRCFKLPPRLFSEKSAWNQRADSAGVSPDSKKYTDATFHILEEHGNTIGMWMLYDEWTYPIFAMETNGAPVIRDVEVRSYEGNQWPPTMMPWYKTLDGKVFARGVPLPQGRIRPSGPCGPGSDGSLILFNPETNEVYDFWQATTAVNDQGISVGGGVEGGSILMTGGVAWFQTGTDALGCQLPICDARAPGSWPRTSCRASGLPYIGGLLVPEDIEQGEIRHALTFTMPRLRHIPGFTMDDPPSYVYPASKTETSDFTDNPYALASGMRIRLKETLLDEAGGELDESKDTVAPITRMFFKALREYGAYLVEGGGGFGIAAEDHRTAWLDVPNDEVARLAGLDNVDEMVRKGTAKWQIIMDELNEQLSWKISDTSKCIPFGVRRPGGEIVSNFEVVEDVTIPDVNWLRDVKGFSFLNT
jgi:hypothetical protein